MYIEGKLNPFNLAIVCALIQKPLYKEHMQNGQVIELMSDIQKLISTSTSFDFLNEQDELYTIADLKKIYNS